MGIARTQKGEGEDLDFFILVKALHVLFVGIKFSWSDGTGWRAVAGGWAGQGSAMGAD